MKTVNIMLDSVVKVKDFVHVISGLEGDYDISSGRYVIDAKSIMGIFSLDLSKKLKLDIHNDECYENAIAELKPFIVD